MDLLDLWFILWGIVLAFLLQVAYDHLGLRFQGIRKSLVGLLLIEILLIALVYMAYSFSFLSWFETVLGLVACFSMLIVTILWLFSKPKQPYYHSIVNC
jgi:hypothetical protein